MAHPLRDKAAVSGIGETAYTRGTPKSGLALQLEASLAAIADAGLSPRDIDGVVPYFPGGGIAEDFLNRSADPMRSIAPLRNAAPQPELLDPPAAVELIIAVGYHQVRYGRLDALAQGPDTPVINQ